VPPTFEPARDGALALRSDAGGGDLDVLDLRLIDLLQADGRIPFTELARQVEVTEKTARRRVSRLLDERYITITAVTDPRTLGFEAMALVLVTVDGSRTPVAVAAELALLPEIDYVTVTSGPFAIQAELVCHDIRELHDVAFASIARKPGVRSVELLPYLRLHYQQARFSGARDNGVRPRQLDETDRAIITHLAADGRAAFRDFASALDVSESTIRSRYARLVESGAARVMCIVNPLRLGYAYTSWVAIRVAGGHGADTVAEAITHLPQVSYVALTAGRFDLVVEVVTANGEDLMVILDHLRGVDGVAAAETWIYIALHYKAIRPRQLD
jgi:DNA-binding Lrp family transcriptional regulator